MLRVNLSAGMKPLEDYQCCLKMKKVMLHVLYLESYEVPCITNTLYIQFP